jgi:hypothetical protein
MSSGMSKEDFLNHGISISRDYLTDTATKIGNEVLKHQGFTYDLPELSGEVVNISASMDGTTVNSKEDG